MHKIVDGLIRENEGRKVPVTLFTKGGGLWLEAIAETGCDAVGLGGQSILPMLAAVLATKLRCKAIWIQACCMQALNESNKSKNILAGFGNGSQTSLILDGIHLDVPRWKAKVFVDAIHNYSKQYHK